MIGEYLALFFAGMLLCNAIPHLASGLRGERFFTPWARLRGTGRSSAVENFLWGAANLFAGIYLLRQGLQSGAPHGLEAAGAGFLLLGIPLSAEFEHRQSKGRD